MRWRLSPSGFSGSSTCPYHPSFWAGMSNYLATIYWTQTLNSGWLHPLKSFKNIDTQCFSGQQRGPKVGLLLNLRRPSVAPVLRRRWKLFRKRQWKQRVHDSWHANLVTHSFHIVFMTRLHHPKNLEQVLFFTRLEPFQHLKANMFHYPSWWTLLLVLPFVPCFVLNRRETINHDSLHMTGIYLNHTVYDGKSM